MNAPRTLILALSAALAACSDDQLRLRPAPEPPRLLSSQFDQRVEMALERLEVERDGEVKQEPLAAGSRLESTERIVFEDAWDGAELVRTFAVLEGLKRHVLTDEFGEHVDERTKSSPLAGARVRFDALGATKFDSAGGDERHLAGLVAGSGLAVFLTDAPLTPNQRWRVDASALAELLHPGGDLELAAAEDSASARESQSQLRRNLSGELEVIFWGLRELGGQELGVLQLVGDVQTHAQTEERELDFVVLQRFELRRRVDGEILWDRRAGRAHAARLECKLEMLSITRQTRTDELLPRVLERRASFRGSSRTDARFEATN